VRGKDPHGPSADLFKARWKQYLKVWDATLGKQKYAAASESRRWKAISCGFSRTFSGTTVAPALRMPK